MLDKNLEFFRLHCKQLYDTFKDYTPTVKNIMEGVDKDTCILQAKQFLESPTRTGYDIDHKHSEKCLHLAVINRLYSRRKEDVGEVPIHEVEENGFMDMLCMIGCGLGYHIEYILSKVRVNTMILVEPDVDVFYESLKHIEWESIFRSTNLVLSIGEKDTALVNKLENVLRQTGRHHIARLYTYKHYKSKETDSLHKLLDDNFNKIISGWGFFEDELLGIQHTTKNIETHKVLHSNIRIPKDTPVFLVGSGPSLDNDIAYIKQNLWNALIVSCGTATTALLDNGITPDVHVELERTVETALWATNKEKLKHITLVAVNTVHPSVFALYKEAYIVLKPNDAGAKCIQESGGKFMQPLHCNPTCVNLGLAFVVNAGFKEVYLFGTDCGYKDKDNHHSKHSAYNDEEWMKDKKFKFSGDIKREGNFGGYVFSDRVYDVCRNEMELLIDACSTQVYNASDGALIYGATSIRTDDIRPLIPVVSTKVSFSDLLYLQSSNVSIDNKEMIANIKEEVDSLLSFTIPKTVWDLIPIFNETYRNTVLLQKHPALQPLFMGTLNYLQTIVLHNTYYYPIDKQAEYIEFALSELDNHWLALLAKYKANHNTVSEETTWD